MHEAAARGLSLGVEYRSQIARRTFVPLRKTDLAPFCVRLHVQIESPRFYKDHLWTKLSARIKEGFSFILFPLVCI